MLCKKHDWVNTEKRNLDNRIASFTKDRCSVCSTTRIRFGLSFPNSYYYDYPPDIKLLGKTFPIWEGEYEGLCATVANCKTNNKQKHLNGMCEIRIHPYGVNCTTKYMQEADEKQIVKTLGPYGASSMSPKSKLWKALESIHADIESGFARYAIEHAHIS